MATGDRIWLGGNNTLQNNGGLSHEGEINEGSRFVLTATTAYPGARTSLTCSRICRFFEIVNRGRDLGANNIELDLPTSTTVNDPGVENFILDLNDVLYSFYSTETLGVITWNWKATEHKGGI